MDFIEPEEAKQLLIRGVKLLDVRAPAEFLHSRIPSAQNYPLLSDQERTQVGKAYKARGQSAAIALGQNLVSGKIRQRRITNWKQFIESEGVGALFCARGGLRSKISQEWLADEGVVIPRVRGGHKKLRRMLLDELESPADDLAITVVTGNTGAGKTKLLHQCDSNRLTTIDLEAIAHHRGSAFGRFEEPQPSQASFENQLATEILRLRKKPAARVLIEDESRAIGARRVPDPLFFAMKAAPLVVINASIETRANNIFEEYISHQSDAALDRFQNALTRISRALGGQRTKIAQSLVNTAFKSNERASHLEWISFLLINYYDPYYEEHLRKNMKRIVFAGDFKEVIEYLQAPRIE